MARTKGSGIIRISKKISIVRHSEFQTLPERIKYLRAKQKPYMTQAQLAFRSRMPWRQIAAIEGGDLSANNMKMNTLKRIAHALDCQLFVNLRPKPLKNEVGCLPLCPELPPLPKRIGKTSGPNLRLAELNGRSPYKTVRQRKSHEQRKATSERPDLEISSEPNPFE